jgi:hypothetical protein
MRFSFDAKQGKNKCSFCDEPMALIIADNNRMWNYCKFHDAQLHEKFPEFYKKIVMPNH